MNISKPFTKEIEPEVKSAPTSSNFHEVVLKKDHEDSGVMHKKGAKIKVDLPTLVWLKKHDIIELKGDKAEEI